MLLSSEQTFLEVWHWIWQGYHQNSVFHTICMRNNKQAKQSQEQSRETDNLLKYVEKCPHFSNDEELYDVQVWEKVEIHGSTQD